MQYPRFTGGVDEQRAVAECGEWPLNGLVRAVRQPRLDGREEHGGRGESEIVECFRRSSSQEIDDVLDDRQARGCPLLVAQRLKNDGHDAPDVLGESR